MTSSQIIPAEDWPPYRLLWSRLLVLARDPETGTPTPWTHGMRRNPLKTLAVLLGLLLVVILWNGRRFWPVLVGFLLGALAGHVFWALLLGGPFLVGA